MNMFQVRLRQALGLFAYQLDRTAPFPTVWASVASGAGFGLLWGVVARIWMRLISARPEFSIFGTAAILTIATLFGTCAGLAYVARRRGWRSWRHYLPRALAVTFFLPFGIAGGTPLMLTVLLATLALTQPAVVGLWVVAALTMLLAVATDITVPLPMAIGAPALAGALTIWKWLAYTAKSRPWLDRADAWLDLAGRACLLLLAAAGLLVVVREIASAKPAPLTALYLLLYLALLYPLILALRIGLAPRVSPPDSN
jgi:hypothetical protein